MLSWHSIGRYEWTWLGMRRKKYLIRFCQIWLAQHHPFQDFTGKKEVKHWYALPMLFNYDIALCLFSWLTINYCPGKKFLKIGASLLWWAQVDTKLIMVILWMTSKIVRHLRFHETLIHICVCMYLIKIICLLLLLLLFCSFYNIFTSL